MTVRVTMPQLGESVTEGTIGRWLKREGDPVEKYEPLVEVITDKVNAEVTATDSGVLGRILVEEGTTVPVGAEICLIEATGAASSGAVPDEGGAQAGSGQIDPAGVIEPTPVVAAETAAAAAGSPAPTVPDPIGVGGTPTAREPVSVAAQPGSYSPSNGSGGGATALGQRTSPLVRRLAREHSIDLSEIAGSGFGGRVTKDDVLRYLAERGAQPVAATATGVATAPPAPTMPAAPAPSVERAAPTPTPAPTALAPTAPTGQPELPSADEEYLPLTSMRRAIAEHMVRSVSTAPHAWTMMEADVTKLVKWRGQIKDDFKRREGVDLTFLPFVVRATVEALREHPILNSSWGGDRIVLKRRINLGIAVALDDGLIVPVIHDADRLSVTGIAHAIADLSSRARASRLAVTDVQGGTFTLNNTGAFGALASMPIINQPQAAILTMEAIVRRPVVLDDDSIAIRSRMAMCISFDHRIVDGLAAGRFLQSVKRRLEAFGPGSSL